MKALINAGWDFYLELPELPAESLVALLSAHKVYEKTFGEDKYTLVTDTNANDSENEPVDVQTQESHA